MDDAFVLSLNIAGLKLVMDYHCIVQDKNIIWILMVIRFIKKSLYMIYTVSFGMWSESRVTVCDWILGKQ